MSDRPTFPYPHRTVAEVEARYHALVEAQGIRALTRAEMDELESERINLGLRRRWR